MCISLFGNNATNKKILFPFSGVHSLKSFGLLGFLQIWRCCRKETEDYSVLDEMPTGRHCKSLTYLVYQKEDGAVT